MISSRSPPSSAPGAAARSPSLHVAAPFFDRDASALEELIGRLEPARLELYVGAGLNVHGPSLAAVLGGVETVRARRYEPNSFVHAKLIGVIEADDRGALLAGSPNLSSAALLGVCTEPGGGNWETAVLREGVGEDVRAVFEGNPKLTLAELSLESVESLEFEERESAAAGLMTLKSAVWRDDGRIATCCAAAAEMPAAVALAWAGGDYSAVLDAEGVTVERLDNHKPAPLLVWLADSDGTAITNRVPVDDPTALEETLLGNRQRRDSRPAELQGLEDAPLIRIALWANDKFIFDPDRESAFRRAREAIEAPEAEEEGDFWERYVERRTPLRPAQPVLPSADPGERRQRANRRAAARATNHAQRRSRRGPAAAADPRRRG